MRVFPFYQQHQEGNFIIFAPPSLPPATHFEIAVRYDICQLPPRVPCPAKGTGHISPHPPTV